MHTKQSLEFPGLDVIAAGELYAFKQPTYQVSRQLLELTRWHPLSLDELLATVQNYAECLARSEAVPACGSTFYLSLLEDTELRKLVAGAYDEALATRAAALSEVPGGPRGRDRLELTLWTVHTDLEQRLRRRTAGCEPSNWLNTRLTERDGSITAVLMVDCASHLGGWPQSCVVESAYSWTNRGGWLEASAEEQEAAVRQVQPAYGVLCLPGCADLVPDRSANRADQIIAATIAEVFELPR